jgi:1,4-dihydroxy-2-naphthoate octaprenyltransferase
VPAPLAAFLRLSRLKFLAGGFAGGALGTAIAAYETGGVGWGAYALAQFAISAFHLMTQYANDYFDRDCDAFATPTPYSGGSGVLVSGALQPRTALTAALVCAAAGTAATLALLGTGRALAAGIAAAIAVLAWCYSAPPVRLLARGLGEADTALVVAVLVPLCAFAAQRQALDPRALASTLPAAAAMFAMMLAVEYPDIDADRRGGKRNLVVRLGAEGAKPLGTVAAVAVFAAVGLALALGAPPGFALLEALTVPPAAGYVRALWARPAADPVADEALAARGVAFFFLVSALGALGYAAAPHATDRTRPAVAGSVIETAGLAERINAALEEVRPGIQRDGGDVWLVRVADRVAYVQLVGACGGCAMSTATLKGSIETVVRARCPDIERVEQL